MLVQAKDDTFIPFEIFRNPAIAANPWIRLVVTEYGGHLGWLAKAGQRFWLCDAALAFADETVG
jgi:predicted alpha/beta-fold hydrolase